MRESDQLSQLIECLYDAALDASLWSGALERSCKFVRGSAANLFWQDAANNAAAVLHSWGDDPENEQLYFQRYAHLNPYFPALAFVEVGEVISGGDLISHDEFRRTRFYLEWVKPRGFIDVLGANLERTATSVASLSIQRHERDGVVDAEARRRCRLIVPHVRRAVAIGKIVDAGKIRELTLTRTLDGLAASVMLVTANACIVYANQKAEAALGDEHVICVRNGMLRAVDPDTDKTLRGAFAAAGDGDAALGVKGIAVPLVAKGTHQFVAHILPLTSGARRAAADGQAVAALFVRELTFPLPSPLETMGRRYKLTPTELRVLGAVLQTGSIDRLANRLGISKATVKTHLNHLFAKTGARRQADLVRLAAGHANPIAD
jgi:DNA-binding CsgD family transcriptional regulator